MLMQKFGVVQAPRTSSNLLEPQQHRVSKVWRGLSQAFGVGRLYRTFSIYSVTGETRSAGCLSTSSGWEPLRTSSNLHEPQHHRENKVWRGLSPAFGVVRLYRTFSFYSIAGETRCAGCFCTSSGWFKHSETSSNLLEPQQHRDSKVWRGLSHEFGVVRLYRTCSSGVRALCSAGG